MMDFSIRLNQWFAGMEVVEAPIFTDYSKCPTQNDSTVDNLMIMRICDGMRGKSVFIDGDYEESFHKKGHGCESRLGYRGFPLQGYSMSDNRIANVG